MQTHQQDCIVPIHCTKNNYDSILKIEKLIFSCGANSSPAMKVLPETAVEVEGPGKMVEITVLLWEGPEILEESVPALASIPLSGDWQIFCSRCQYFASLKQQ